MKTATNLHRARSPLRRCALACAAGVAVLIGTGLPAAAAPPVTTGLTLHLDASQLTGLSDGATVTTWTDMSGQNNHATAAGTPIYKTAVLNGQPVVRFNGASSFTTADISSQFPTAATVFIATTISNDNAYTLVKANPGVDEWWRWDGDGTSYPGFFRGSRLESYTAMPNSGSHLFAISSSASAWEMSINGASQGVEGANYDSGGAPLVIGNGSSGGGLNGDIAEVLIYSRVLTATEANAVGYYLEAKYGISSTYENPNPTVPENLQAVAGDGQVSLTWLAFPGAVSYNVKRSGTSGGPYTTVGTPAGPSFTNSSLANGTPYYYVVSANTGSESSNSSEKSATPTGVNATLSTVTGSQPAQLANGVASVTITVTLRNSSNTPIPGKVVTLAATGSPSIATVTGTTGVDGRAVFTATSTTVGPAVFTATDTTSGNLVIAQTAAVDFIYPNTPQSINVNLDNIVQPGLVGPAGGLGAVWNTIGASSATNLLLAIGSASNVGFTSSGTGGWGGPNKNDTEPTLRLLKCQWVNFGANGTTQQLVITGLDSDKTYDLTIASAILITSNQCSRGEWSTTNTTSTVGSQAVDNRENENGSTWVRGNNYVLFEDVVPDGSGNITVNGFAITQQPTYDIRLPLNGFQLVESVTTIAGPVNNAMSTVTATPAAVVANGVSASTVKVTLRDASGVRVANNQVTLANNGGLTPPPALTTNAQGVANFAVSSSTVGTVVFTATVVADSLTLTDTANVEFTDPAAPVAYNVNIYNAIPATGLIGVVGAPGETWNQGTTSASNLIDATGTVVSSVNVTGFPDGGYTVNAALNVFDDNRNFFSKGQDTTISITGLVPDTAYDLYIYSLSHNNGSWGDFTNTERAAGDFVTSNTVLGNGQSQWLDNGISGVNGDSFIANGNYVVFQSIVSNNLGNISVLADALDGPGSTRLHISGLQIRPATGMSLDYAAWRESRYPGLGMPDADDDGDGLSNDYERIFGMNPTNPASASPYWGGFDPDTGSLGYTRRRQSLINMNYKVQYSTDLANWFEDNAAIQTVESVSNDIEFMGVSIDPLLLSQPKLFVRAFGQRLSTSSP